MTRFYIGYVMYHSVLVTWFNLVTSCPRKISSRNYIIYVVLKAIINH